MEYLDIGQLLIDQGRYFWIDVRSPKEYEHAHIPNAMSLPIFSDEERHIIGTLYKQESREKAISKGLDFFGLKMSNFVEIVKNTNVEKKTLAVYCWRGGMRSRAMAWLLDFYGFEVKVVQGGYKAFRNWALARFDDKYTFKILGGYTGSGKTEILNSQQELGLPVIDLEGLARHKGSTFGGLGLAPQPSQEMFENMLSLMLFRFKNQPIWLEDESSRIGALSIPKGIREQMIQAPLYFIQISFEDRLHRIMEDYGGFELDDLIASVLRIQRKLGGLLTHQIIEHMNNKQIREAFSLLLSHYDGLYKKGIRYGKPLERPVFMVDIGEELDIFKK